MALNDPFSSVKLSRTRMNILFVCLGNICRSPTAEAIFRKKFAEAGIDATFDSAGTADYHVGERSDPRSIKHAEARGYAMTHIGRQAIKKDFERFDLVLAMDDSNYDNLIALGLNAPERAKLKRVTEPLHDPQVTEIPDPYYGGAAGFDHVIDLLERCAEAWIQVLRKV